MNVIRNKTLTYAFLSLLVTTFAAPFVAAQDNSDGRYRPEGRQIGVAAGREFSERIYEVRTYDPQTDVDEFASATIFYPLTLSFDPPNGAIAFVPGFRATGANYEWWGPALASLGYIVLILDTNTPNDALAARSAALVAAVDFLIAENENSESPVSGKIDVDKIAIMGHSMGGGASLHAAAQMGDTVKAVVPLSLYCCEPGQPFSADYSSLTTPSLLIASAVDDVAPPAEHARLLYDSISSSAPKIYMEFAEGDHMIVANGGPDLATIGRFTLAFLKVHLDGKTNLANIIAEPGADYADKFSNYLTNP